LCFIVGAYYKTTQIVSTANDFDIPEIQNLQKDIQNEINSVKINDKLPMSASEESELLHKIDKILEKLAKNEKTQQQQGVVNLTQNETTQQKQQVVKNS